MSDYSKAVIYIITTGDDLYVGSTYDFHYRKLRHKSVIHKEYDTHCNYYLYKKIRENNGEWNMEIYKHFPCENNEQLRVEEQKIINELNPTLNMTKAYTSKEEWKTYFQTYRYENKEKINEVYQKKYRENNKEKIYEKIMCECGCETSKSNIARHRTSAKHIKLMEEINLNK